MRIGQMYFTAIRLAKEFDLDYVIVHGTEGHLIADELKAEHTRVLSGPFCPTVQNRN